MVNKILLGIDVGGTFSDFIILEHETQQIHVFKVSSTPENPVNAISTGLQDAFKQGLVPENKQGFLAHGTTVATNAVIQRKGARTALITTKGFEDVLEIGRQNRPELYSLCPKRPRPIIIRENRYGISERVNAQGRIQEELDTHELKQIIKLFKEKKYESIAVSLLFSFLNNEHEQIIKTALENEGFLVSTSSEVHPVIREYERTNTTALDAFVKPLIATYMKNLETEIKNTGFHGAIGIMQSNGGMVSAQKSSRKPVSLLLSGLAGGVLAGKFTGKIMKDFKIITLDIGGTSTDVSLIDGDVKVVKEAVLGDLPVMTETVDVLTIGAGGGSIAQVKDGLFVVGPESAGADPGPLCYGRGGKHVTVTDADVVTGRIMARNFAGGTMSLAESLAREGIKTLGEQLGLSVEETALGIQDVYRNNIVLALRKISLERGHDPREFALVPFGGQGPVHGLELAELLGTTRVYFPPYPGVWSAFGLIASDYRQDLTKTIQVDLADVSLKDLEAWFVELQENGVKRLVEDGFKKENVQAEWKLDMKYKGQGYELNIPVKTTKHASLNKNTIKQAFEKTHQQKYGFTFPNTPIQVINIQVTVIGKRPVPTLPKPQQRENTKLRPIETRKIYVKHKWQAFHVYRKQDLRLHDSIQGPAIIEQPDTTVFIPETWKVRVHETGHLIAKKQKEEKQ